MIAFAFAFIVPAIMWGQNKKQIRISCVGASITEGYGTDQPWSKNSYPGQLETFLGKGYHVENYGRGGCTMLRKGDCPYWTMEKFEPSLKSNPDIVFIDLGGNDAKLRNRIHKADFIKDACDLVKIYQDLPSHPRVILMTATTGFTQDSTEIWDTAIMRDINPLIIQAAKKAKVEVIDMHSLLIGRRDLVIDGIHPNNEGAGIMARHMANYLKTHPKGAPAEYDETPYNGKITYNSYKGLIMAGYQGWHDCPDDGDNRGWYHYHGRGKFQPGTYNKQPDEVGFQRGFTNVDLWPDVSEYKKLYPSPFIYEDGTTCYLPSPSDSSTVNTHFRWMEEYGLDGVFMQRFVAEIRNPSGLNHFNRVLSNAMWAANHHNRALSVMYDLSGFRPGEEEIVLKDIQNLDRMFFLHDHAKNPSYLWHNGKPLVAVWGVGFNDNRQYSFKEARTIIEGLKKLGFSVLIGVPTYWREQGHDTLKDKEQLLGLIKECDIVMPWFVGRYNEQQYDDFAQLIDKDLKWGKENHVDYAPLCFPGFSWLNMHYPRKATQIPRNKGSFFRKQLDRCIAAGAEMIYVAMFDEIDEGTAIMKCASRVPKASPGATFEPMDGDLYLKIVGQAAQQLKQRTVSHLRFAPQEGAVSKYEQDYRHEICLNGLWDFQAVQLPASYIQGKGMAPELTMPTEKWDSVRIKIPSPWNVNDFANRNLEGPDHRAYPSYPERWKDVKMAWMRRKVQIPQEWNGQEIKLHFEAVAGNADIYVNGKKAGSHFDLFLPFDLNITDLVEPGQEAEILVGVRSQKLFEDQGTAGRRIVPAGSMWGYLVNGIWQDVSLVAVPKINVNDVFVKPLLNENRLEVEVSISNNTAKKAKLKLSGDIRPWKNLAGKSVEEAPVPNWTLGESVLTTKDMACTVNAGDTLKYTFSIPVSDEQLACWTPEQPNLYGLLVNVKQGKQRIDQKYERFGWRQWTINGTQHLLNGKPYVLKGDSWHFMGIPQSTRRYAWAWYKAIKDMNANAVRLHAQVYPRYYLDMADEMGICVLNESAIWASDGGPKLDSPVFWKNSYQHLKDLVLRDRNHASVFGWSVGNENKPVILYVYQRPELMAQLKEAWQQWHDIVVENDPTRPWISADGEDDGDGILPVTVGHYGDHNSMVNWRNIGKPWGIGETGMCYYGTPEQVATQNGERSYESFEGRSEGLAKEAHQLLSSMREMDASYSSVFNMVWYGLKPLPLGKSDITTAPSLADGIFFPDYKEGEFGVQPERIGPCCTTFNPGYDPALPLYETLPLFDGMSQANAGKDFTPYMASIISNDTVPEKNYTNVIYIGNENSSVKTSLDAQGMKFSNATKKPATTLYIIDASAAINATALKTVKLNIKKGADVWVADITPEGLASIKDILPADVALDKLERSSFLPKQTSWMRGLKNSDFYFCELQNAEACHYTLSGEMAEKGDVLLEACRTNWRKWNKRAEELKTAATLRSENECTASLVAMLRYKTGKSIFYLSTLSDWTQNEKGFNALSVMLQRAGIPCSEDAAKASSLFMVNSKQLLFPKDIDEHKANGSVTLQVYSNRPLDDLLIEPNVPKLSLFLPAGSKLTINGKAYTKGQQRDNMLELQELPLQQGWNSLKIETGESLTKAHFQCDNREAFISTLKVKY